MGKKRDRKTSKTIKAKVLPRNRRTIIVSIGLAVTLIVVSAILAHRASPPSVTHQGSGQQVSPAAPDAFASNSPTIEYIHLGGRLVATEQPVDFLDVTPSHPYYADIKKIAERGVTVGCGGGNYCPDSPVTREQMAAFIMRARGEFIPPTPPSQRFNDVPPSNLFYNFIDRLAVLQITLGCSADPPLYCPVSNVTHEQMSAFMNRARGFPNPPQPSQQTFCDVPPSNIFYSHIEFYAVTSGIWRGCNDDPSSGCFCPSSNVTRGQMARILVRAFNL